LYADVNNEVVHATIYDRLASGSGNTSKTIEIKWSKSSTVTVSACALTRKNPRAMRRQSWARIKSSGSSEPSVDSNFNQGADLKKIIGKIILRLSRSIGSSGLNLVRRVLPVSIKLALSHMVTDNLDAEEPFIVAGNGLKFIPIKDTVFLHIRMEGFYEKRISDITAKIVRAGDTAIDIGANFGWYTNLLCKQVGATGRVHCFEPNAKMFPILKQNIALNQFENWAVAMQIGIGSEKTLAQLSAADGELGLGHIVSENKRGSANSLKIQTVQIDTLDNLFATSVGEISFIKIDVEGFEPFVFMGGKKVLESDNPPVLQVEFNCDALKQHSGEVSRGFVDYLNAMDAGIFAGQSGTLIKIDTVHLDENNDLFIFPKTGKFADRRPV
jgi:FkbM family methyltransferase